MVKIVNSGITECKSVARQFVAAYDAHNVTLEKFRMLYLDQLMEVVSEAKGGPHTGVVELCKMIPGLSEDTLYFLADVKFLGRTWDGYSG